MRTKLEERVTEVERAARRLAATTEMGPRARRNARAALSRALREVRVAADDGFPAPPRKQGQRRDPATRVSAMRRDGWDELLPTEASTTTRIADLAHRGIRIVKVVVPVTNNLGVKTGHTRIFAPPWTKDVPAPKLEAARRSHQKAQAFKALTKMQRDPAAT